MAGRPPALIALDRLAALGRQQTDALRRAPVDRTRPSAAVLVPLFVGREEHNQRLHVLLSRRSHLLRAYSGDTALPGGKVDPTDATLEDAARREAYEEIGLPIDQEKAVYLAQGAEDVTREGLRVTPVIVWVKDKTPIPELNPAEVTEIFALPLENFLTSKSPFDDASSTSPDPARPYYSFWDVERPGSPIRRHQFLTNRERSGIQPVRGLTASILIDVATKAFDRQPDFSLRAEGGDEEGTHDSVESVSQAKL